MYYIHTGLQPINEEWTSSNRQNCQPLHTFVTKTKRDWSCSTNGRIKGLNSVEQSSVYVARGELGVQKVQKTVGGECVHVWSVCTCWSVQGNCGFTRHVNRQLLYEETDVERQTWRWCQRHAHAHSITVDGRT